MDGIIVQRTLAGWLSQQLASQQDASKVQMTIAQTKVWAACLGGLGCLSRAACCVCRVGAGLRLVGSRRVSSRLVHEFARPVRTLSLPEGADIDPSDRGDLVTHA